MVLLIAQLVATALIAGWLTLGVWDNIRHPANNETYTAEVMAMSRMQVEYPDAFANVAHRAVTDRRWQLLAFRLVVLGELLGALLLLLGTSALASALIGWTEAALAREFAMLGATVFTAIWGGFLVVGNYFCYWFCHEGAQNTHYQMTLWGLGTLILLAQSG